MANSSPKASATDEELSKLFEGITTTDATAETASPSEHDILAELGSLAADRPASRANTPRPPSSTASRRAISSRHEGAGPLPSLEGDASSVSRRNDNATSNSTHRGRPPQPPSPSDPPSGWWGGLFATASAAVKTAEAAVKDIHQNEETRRWAAQVKGNVGALRGRLGDEIRSRALPTFNQLLHTLAPPISAHERLQIHITHHLIGYPALDPLIYRTFSRVMAQVEGGDLLVIQRGQDSSPGQRSDDGGLGFSGPGWGDGPWWRQPVEKRNLGLVRGAVEATKLAEASAKSYANDFYSPSGGVEAASRQAMQSMTESNPVRDSHIFLAIQAVGIPNWQALLLPLERETGHERAEEAKVDDEDLVAFSVYLYDPEHGIHFGTMTQPFPSSWAEWMDTHTSTVAAAPNGLDPAHDRPTSPDITIAETMTEGGPDPREWVADWVEDVLSLGIGIIAQSYVTRRMGIGPGHVAVARPRHHALESGGGEAARAI